MDMDLHEEQSQQRSAQESNKSATKSNPSVHKIEHKISKREQTQLLHKLIFETGGLPDGTKVYYKSRKDFMGEMQGHGIFCFCCKKTVSPTEFERHAGMKTLRKPYNNILLGNGVSLHTYALKLKKKDGECRVCQSAGELLSCGRCCRPICEECLSETSISERLLCKYCSKNHVGPDSPEKIEKPWCTSVLVACTLCRSHNYIVDDFDDHTVIICDQCERGYHIGCLRYHNMANLTEIPEDDWYCTPLCNILYHQLEHLVDCGPEVVPPSVLDILEKKVKDEIANRDVKFVLVRGDNASENNKLLLDEAVEMLCTQFKLITDSETNMDIITSMAYGQQMGGMDFKRVYTAMITIDSEVVTAGVFRLFGEATAVLSIVATTDRYKRKDFFRVFFNCLEALLSYLNIEKLLIPASTNTTNMWVDKFGFKEVAPEQMDEYSETQTSMLAFRGTSVLEKEVPGGHTTYTNCLKSDSIWSYLLGPSSVTSFVDARLRILDGGKYMGSILLLPSRFRDEQS